MRTGWKAVPVALAIAATAMFSSAALAHDPDEGGQPLNDPFGDSFSFIANFQTDPNPFNPLNKNVTSSDIAFWGKYAYVGDYGGFRIFDISQPVPTLVSNMRCYGAQGDPSVFDRDGDGAADTLTLSVDQVLSGPECGAGPAAKVDGKYPAGAWEGLRVFDVSVPTAPVWKASVYQDCGSHTNTLLPNPKGGSIYVLNSSYPLLDGPTCGPPGVEKGRDINHGVVQVIEIPFSDVSKAKELTELPVVYPDDTDGIYKPASEQGLAGVLDNFLGCHDLSAFPAKGIVGAACGEQAQVWNIDPETGLPDTTNPRWVYDQPNVDFWHSATFSWDGKVANFIDESFGDGCPTTTTKTGGLPGGPRVFETGNMFFFETEKGKLLSEYRNPRRTNGDSFDPDKPERLTYCSSHLGMPVPATDRYLLVNAYYRGGSSVIDFSNPSKPKEIAYADMRGTNTWSAYSYPRTSGKRKSIPVYSNDGLSRNYGGGRYPEAAYGFMRFHADVGNTDLVGLDRLNPQLQDRAITTSAGLPRGKSNGKPRAGMTGRKAPKNAKNSSGRPPAK